MNANLASWLKQKIFLGFDFRRAAQMSWTLGISAWIWLIAGKAICLEYGLECGKPRMWLMMSETRYLEAVRVSSRHGLEDAMDQAGELEEKERKSKYHSMGKNTETYLTKCIALAEP